MTTKTCNLCDKQLAPGLAYFCRLCWFTDVPPLDRQQLRQLHDRKHPVAAKVDSIVRRVREKKAKDAPAPVPTPRSSPPAWFGKALADAMVADINAALTPAQVDEIEAAIVATGQPPAWYVQHLKDAGLRLKGQEAAS